MMGFHRIIALAALAAVATVLGGCVTATVQEVRESRTGMDASDAVVVLGRRSRPKSAETELDFVTCISRNLSKGAAGIKVIEEQQFMDSLFPWFEPRTAPVKTADLPELIALPPLARRLEEMNLRYLVWVEGSTERTDSAGSLTCSVTATGAGCFGFLTWENDSSYEAFVWDVRNGRVAGKLSSDAVGTSYVPAIVVPVPFIARVRSSACSSLANQLKSFLANEA
ncbi:MAG TPA: hypothetical protein VIS55_02440 [Pseudomonadales bacterium]|jgi:hypothetical protein